MGPDPRLLGVEGTVEREGIAPCALDEELDALRRRD
jgi:hypothetical protein